MNPRGRQYALAGTLSGWTRLEDCTRRQRAALRSSYSGLNPRTYSRYGHRQWAAPLPGVRVVVKDPFAMLSMRVVNRITGAVPILLFRHPGASLTSYRRMGWSPDLDEVGTIVEEFLLRHGDAPGVVPLPHDVPLDEVDAMAWFWNALYGIALHDASAIDPCVILAHHDIARGGEEFGTELFLRLGLEWNERASEQMLRSDDKPAAVDANALHNLGRAPALVANEWESKITADERSRIEEQTDVVYSLLLARSLRPDDT